MEQSESIFDFHLDTRSKTTLRSIAIWATIVAVCGFVSLAFEGYKFVKGLLLIQASSTFDSFILYIAGLSVYAVIAFFLNYFLVQFGSNSRKSLAENEQTAFNAALRNLKMYIRFLGILLILVIAFVLMLFIVSLIFG